MEEKGLTKLKDMALTYPERAERLTIINDEHFQQVKEFLQAIKTLRKRIQDACQPRIDAAHKAHKAEIAYRDKLDEPLAKSEEIVKPKISGYLREQERIRREAEEKARKEVEERKRKVDEALRKAAEAEKKGDAEEAEKILAPALAEEEETKEVPLPEKPETSGIALSQVWKFEVVDAKKIPRKYLKVDEVLIGKMVRVMKEKTNIPGIRAYSEDSVRSRTL